MKQNIKCYAYYKFLDKTMILAQFANQSQRNFLMFELDSIVNKIQNKQKKTIQSITTSNGIWYYKIQMDNVHLVLSTKQVNFNIINMFLAKAINFIAKTDINHKEFINRFKFYIVDSIKLFNANNLDKLQQLNQNVEQLQGIMKGNVSRIVSNMTDLQSVQKKSQLMSSLSMNLQRDSKALEQKMKKRKLWIKIIVSIAILGILALVIYILFGK